MLGEGRTAFSAASLREDEEFSPLLPASRLADEALLSERLASCTVRPSLFSVSLSNGNSGGFREESEAHAPRQRQTKGRVLQSQRRRRVAREEKPSPSPTPTFQF